MNLHPSFHDELARQRQLELIGPRTSSRRGGDRSTDATDLTTLVDSARAGDQQAWDALVGRFTPVMRGVARGYGLNAADVDDVVQTAWTAVFVHIERLREPEAIGGWLLVTARREALRILKRSRREVLTQDHCDLEELTHSTPETAVLESEQSATLVAALGRLPERQRTLLDSLDQPGASYADVSRKLNIPVGSIGPTRERALRRLRRDRRLLALQAPGR